MAVFLSLAPTGSVRKYKLAEFPDWKSVDDQVVTESVKLALVEGRWLPYIEPVRKRIRGARGFELRLWDGREIDDPSGSYSISLYGLHFRDRGVVSCARYLLPLDFELQKLVGAAQAIATDVRFKSGHGGLTFAYDPGHRSVAFEEIYYRARRFWCVDIEDLEATLSARSPGIKTLSWITMLGNVIEAYPQHLERLNEYQANSRLDVTTHPRGCVATIGSRPIAGDINRPGDIPAEYFQTARILESAFMKDHPDFSTIFFADPNTMGWIRRFSDPTGWAMT